MAEDKAGLLSVFLESTRWGFWQRPGFSPEITMGRPAHVEE